MTGAIVLLALLVAIAIAGDTAIGRRLFRPAIAAPAAALARMFDGDGLTILVLFALVLLCIVGGGDATIGLTTVAQDASVLLVHIGVDMYLGALLAALVALRSDTVPKFLASPARPVANRARLRCSRRRVTAPPACDDDGGGLATAR